MATLPPKRIVTPTDAAPVPVPASAPTKPPPAKLPKPAAPPAVKAVKKVAPKKVAPVKKSATRTAAPVKSSPRAATENVVPRVPKVKTRIWGDEAVELGVIIVDMRKIVPAISKSHVELRSVSERLQAMFNEKLGINCRKVYTTLADVAKIVKFLQRVPEELVPAKWPRAFERIEKLLAKA
jgi:hypothetical protein